MSLSQEDIINAVAEMSVKDVVELIEAMEEKFGVSAAAAVAAGPAGGDAGGAAEEQTEFDVVLTAAGDKKVNVPWRRWPSMAPWNAQKQRPGKSPWKGWMWNASGKSASSSRAAPALAVQEHWWPSPKK